MHPAAFRAWGPVAEGVTYATSPADTMRLYLVES